ncbi:MAG: hypothetical protein HRT57_16710, partial [Crocinitomicaceae bacterium]|nr:hypothetical protein [Crocinitomicaceae bacterium]
NENGDGTGATGSAVIKNGAWNAQIGGEYHLDGTDRISPYFMLGVNLGGGSMETTNTESDGANYVLGLASTSNAKMSMFGVGLGAGLDIYIIENLYCGFELGFNYAGYNYGDFTSSTTVTAGGVSTTVTGVTAGGKASYMNTGAGTAAVRFGWRF